MNELTPRQSEVLNAIKDYKTRVGFPPTIFELAGLIGCSSPNAAAAHVTALKKKGYISVAPGVARGITITDPQPQRTTVQMNTQVKVKLFEPAIEELKRLHEENRRNNPSLSEFCAPAADDEGYSTMTLWEVMSNFGGICYNGAPVAFEMAIVQEAE